MKEHEYESISQMKGSMSHAACGEPASISRANDMAVLNSRSKDDNTWYDLALRENGDVHIYYGVTDSGLNDKWMELIEAQEKAG